MHGTVLATLPKALLAFLASKGHDPDALEREAGLPREMWSDAEARVPREQVDALWDLGVRVTGDGALGAHFAFAMPAGNAGVLETVTQTAKTARDGLRHVCRYWHLLNDGVDLTLEGDQLHLWTRSERPLARAWIDLTVVSLTVIAGRSLPRPRAPVEVRLPYAEDAWTSELALLVRAPLVCGASHLVIAYPGDALDQALLGANPALHAVAAKHAEDRLGAHAEQDWPARVRRAIEARLEEGNATLPRVARALATSERTLQRRLAEHGTTLRAVLDDARRNIAVAEVERGERSFTDIAFLLGFSEASAFDRAFRRWTGESPSERRRAKLR